MKTTEGSLFEGNKTESYTPNWRPVGERKDDNIGKHTDMELADAHIFPSELSPAEKKDAEKEFSEFRKQRLLQMTMKDNIYSHVMQLKYIIKNYIKRKIVMPKLKKLKKNP